MSGFSENLDGKVRYTILDNKVRKCEVQGMFNGKPVAKRRLKILLIDEESMCEPIEDAVRLIRQNNLFIDREAAKKEIFMQELKGTR